MAILLNLLKCSEEIQLAKYTLSACQAYLHQVSVSRKGGERGEEREGSDKGKGIEGGKRRGEGREGRGQRGRGVIPSDKMYNWCACSSLCNSENDLLVISTVHPKSR